MTPVPNSKYVAAVRDPTNFALAALTFGLLVSCRVERSAGAPVEEVSVPPVADEVDPVSHEGSGLDEVPAAAEPEPASRSPSPTTQVEPPWREQDWPRIAKVQPVVKAAAAEHGIDPHLINAIIWHESKFHPRVTGPGGSAGLMQLMPSTSRALARKLGRPHRPYDVRFNVEVGTYLLARLMKKFDGDERLALAGYGLGSGRVRGLLNAGKPLPARTERFIAKVQRWREAFAQADADHG
jgi:hypothetical protein